MSGVELARADAHAAVRVLGALIRERAIMGRPVPYGVQQLHSRLRLAVDVSSPGQSAGGDAAGSLIGTRLAAEMLGWGERRVRRHAADLDGRIVGGRMLYPQSSVREYADALHDKETRE